MTLLFSTEIKRRIVDELSTTSQDINIISAYCKLDAIRFIEKHIKNHVHNKKLMVRFRFDDILRGVSDLEIYEYCVQNGWELYVRFDLHAKTYVFDRIRGIIGSANLTKKGIGLAQNSNYEIAQLSSISYEEMSKIDALFDNAILMTDGLYSRMKQCVIEHGNVANPLANDWSSDILNLFTSSAKVLFVHEFPNTFSLSDLYSDSLDFLGLDHGQSIDDIRNAFVSCNAYLWLRQKLQEAPECEMYYGALSAALHDAIINDPKPYRKEVKELQSNFLNWIIELNIEEIMIERPNHSQRIRLRQPSAAVTFK